MIQLQRFDEATFKVLHLIQRNIVEQSVCTTVENSNLLFYGHRAVLRLNQQLAVLTSLVNRQCGNRVHVATELGERFQFTILCLVDLQCSRHFLHSLNLRVTTYTGYRDTDVDSRTRTLVEQVSFKEYLSVGDRNHVRRDISRYVTSLRFDDRQCRERTTAFDNSLQTFRKIVHFASHFLLTDNLGSTFQQTGVQIEDITRISLTT